jgi:hypothetical protein
MLDKLYYDWFLLFGDKYDPQRELMNFFPTIIMFTKMSFLQNWYMITTSSLYRKVYYTKLNEEACETNHT